MNQFSQHPPSQNLQLLYDLIASHEDWLMYRILEYAKERKYTKYTSTLAEAWRVSICGLSEPLMKAIKDHSNTLELDPEANYHDDPIASFGIIEAQRHRSRGVSLNLFLGLMKYYRQSYMDLLELGQFQSQQIKQFELFINRFFDRIELGFCTEWISLSEDHKLTELQNKNRLLTNEKNKYLTVFESINQAIFLLDQDNQIINFNEKAALLFTDLDISGSFYYALSAKKIELAWLTNQIIHFNKSENNEEKFELQINTNQGNKYFEIKLKKMLDVSEKFLGTVVICNDITEFLEIKKDIEENQERLREIQHIAHFGNWTWDLKTNKLYWSREIYIILEENPLNFQPDRQQFLNKIYPLDLEHFKQQENEAIKNCRNFSIDFRIMTKNNEIKWLHQQSFITANNEHEAIRMMGIIQDITERKKSEIELRESEARLKTIINTNVNGLVVISEEGKVLFVNPAAELLFGKKAEELLGNLVGLPLVTGESTEVAIPHKNGELIIAQMRVVEIIWESKTAFLASLVDITERKKAEEKLKILYQACEQSPASIVITDAQGNIQYVNPKFENVTGYTQAEVIGKNTRILKSGYTSDSEYRQLWETLIEGKEWHGEFHNKKKNGECYWEFASISPLKDEFDQITHFVAVKEDITQRKKAEELLTHQANFDPLTDLPNRTLGMDRLQQAIAWAQRNNKYIAVMFLDLDHFKIINDTLGHKYGDQLLILAAKRLSNCLRKTDTISRLGGDEFLIIISNLDSPSQSESIAKKILNRLQKAFILQGEEIFVSASIGITIYPNDSQDLEILMQNADMAMYSAKRQGRNNFQFFTSILNEQAKRRMLRENHLRNALKKEEIYIAYQPLINLKTEKIIGAEALMRWHNFYLGLVSPIEFIPIAEETGIIIDLGEWLLEKVCHQVSLWHQEGHLLKIAVNLSPRQFRETNLLEMITNIVKKNQIDPRYLELEITEQLLLEDVPGAKDLLIQLHQRNFTVSMDDFGTGYSSLSYLQKFPFKVLKIDKSFIRDIPYDADAIALVKSIITMAHGLKLKVVAEGIESEAQLRFLQAENCDYGQGYYFSKPLISSDFLTLLNNNNSSYNSPMDNYL